MDKISVIIPVYNNEKYINACLDSVLKQTHQNLEIIVIDDGSVDRSGIICDKYAKSDARIKVIHKKNAGVSAARNAGLSVATGDWISFIDSDDTMELDMYELLLKLAKEHNAEISHCGYKRFNEEGVCIKEVSGTHLVIEQKPEEAIQCMLDGRYFVSGLWNKLFMHSCIKGIKFCQELKNNEDIAFNAMAFQRANLIVFCDETKYCYYEHSTSACNCLDNEKQVRDSVQASKMVLNECETSRVEYLILQWHFQTQLRLYRFLLFSKDNVEIEMNSLKGWLIKNYTRVKKLGIRGKANYYLMIYFATLYRGIYRIYDCIRKPNWDVK